MTSLPWLQDTKCGIPPHSGAASVHSPAWFSGAGGVTGGAAGKLPATPINFPPTPPKDIAGDLRPLNNTNSASAVHCDYATPTNNNNNNAHHVLGMDNGHHHMTSQLPDITSSAAAAQKKSQAAEMLSAADLAGYTHAIGSPSSLVGGGPGALPGAYQSYDYYNTFKNAQISRQVRTKSRSSSGKSMICVQYACLGTSCDVSIALYYHCDLLFRIKYNQILFQNNHYINWWQYYFHNPPIRANPV